MSAIAESSRPIQPGEPAPDFSLPAADREGIVSLTDYRGRHPLLLALFRGLYCPYCRRNMLQLAGIAEKLKGFGVETLAVTATVAERARLYFKYRHPRIRVGADPDLVTHRAYGVPRVTMTPEIRERIYSAAGDLARELGMAGSLPTAPGEMPPGLETAIDGYARTDEDIAEGRQHGMQFTAQFLIDRNGIVRWANVECVRDGLNGLERMPPEEELLAAAAASSRRPGC